MKKVFFLCLLLHSTTAFSQGLNSIWVFGDSSGIDFRNVNNPLPIFSGMDSRGSCVSISDSAGNLKLYAATLGYINTSWATRVFNSQNQILQGCDSITGESWYNELILVPRPDSLNQYILFSTGNYQGINEGLFYSVIDMNQNGGLGAIVDQNIQLLNLPLADCITAVKHGNGRDWWILSKFSNLNSVYNRYFVLLVTPDSIYNPLIEDFNDAKDLGFQKIIWNSQSTKFMQINVRGYMSEFGFDRCSGTISLIRNIFPEQSSGFNRAFWDGAYSPNGNVFYVSRSSYGGVVGSYNYLLQYDLTSANIAASCDTLGSSMYPTTEGGAVRLGPDNKIYYTQSYISPTAMSYPYADTMRNVINENLGVIHNPDIIGSGCNFLPYSFYLNGKRTYYGLPTNPDYSLGPLAGSACDTILSVNNESIIPEKIAINIFPNPVRGELIVSCTIKMLRLEIVNPLGVVIKIIQYPKDRINVSELPEGVYFMHLMTERGEVASKFVKE